jgi:hypothetical protein
MHVVLPVLFAYFLPYLGYNIIVLELSASTMIRLLKRYNVRFTIFTNEL